MGQNDSFKSGLQGLAEQSFNRLMGTRLAVFQPGEVALGLPVRDDMLQQNGKNNYARPAAGAKLVARGSVVHAGKRQAVCRCDVFDVQNGGQEVLCAVAQGTIVLAAAEHPKTGRQGSDTEGAKP